MRRRLALALAAVGASCVPNLGGGDSLVDTTRILAIRADPAEAKPGSQVAFTTLVAGPTGTVPSAPIAWSFCTAPRPLTDDDVVSDACLGSASSLVSAGDGEDVTATTPADGCSLFGPDTPPGGFRPTDPDETGGYYQPLRAALTGALTFELARIQCDLAGASAEAATQFAAAYHANLNPTLAPVTATIGGAPASFTTIPAGAHVTLTASWSAADAETYAWFDLATQTVTTKRESMQVAWYATAGTLDTESTGRAEDDPATTTTDGWSAPGTAGATHLWIVLRDSRGGVDFVSIDAVVAP